MEFQSSKGRIIKANRLLQAKIGTGLIDDEKVSRSQKLIDENNVDFIPMAEAYIQELETAIKKARKADENAPEQELIQSLTVPVMHLKANGLMFNYALVSSLANIMLNFLEAIEAIDEDVLDITDAHKTTIAAIISNRMHGDGGTDGQNLVSEIKNACRRYFAKQASKGLEIDDESGLFS
jgi:hypothetical protein